MEFRLSIYMLLSLVALVSCDGESRTVASSGSYTDTLLDGIRRMETQAQRKAAVVSPILTNTILDECYPRCPIGTVCSTDIDGIKRCVAAPVVATAAIRTGYNDPLIASAAASGSIYSNEPLYNSARVVSSGYNNDPIFASAAVGTGYNDPLVSSADFGTSYGEPASMIGSRHGVPAVAVVGVESGYNAPILASNYGYSGGVVLSGAANLDAGFRIRGAAGLSYGNAVNSLAGCGAVLPECRANQVNPGFLNGAYKYTYNHSLNRCVQISVCSTCATISGPRHNLFNSLFICNRSCRL